MANNIFQQRIKPVTPKVLENERIFVYVPKATTKEAGIAYYNPDDFTISNLGQVSVKWPYAHNGDFGLVKIEPEGAGYLQFTDDNNHYLEVALDKLDIHNNELIDTKITAHNNDIEAHNDIRLKLTEIRTDLLDGTLKPLYSTNADNYTENGTIASKFNDKLDVKPNGIDYLIVNDKLNNKYIPAGLGGGLVYAGTFDEFGVITASEYVPTLQGTLITDLDIANSTSLFFQYTSKIPYILGDLQIDFGDQIICNGNIDPAWTKIDNSDKVVSVNGMVGAVNISALPNPQKLIIHQDEQTTEYDGSSEVNIDISSGIQELVGTEDQPINFATSMEVGKLYSCTGYIQLTSANTQNISPNYILIYKRNNDNLTAYGVRINNSYISVNSIFVTSTILINDSGFITSWGSAIAPNTINGSPTSTSDIYAPTSSGNAGQILQSNGSGRKPTWIDASNGIQTLIGTEESPINLATSLSVGQLYSCQGVINAGANYSFTSLGETNDNFLLYKWSDTGIYALTCSSSNIDGVTHIFNGYQGICYIIIDTSGNITGVSNANFINLLNGNSNVEPGTPLSIYAPTTSGEAGQVLQSNGADQAPSWNSLSTTISESSTDNEIPSALAVYNLIQNSIVSALGGNY